jgi:hypothetical protein
VEERERKKEFLSLESAGSIKPLTTVAKMRINEIFNIRQYQVVEHERRGRVKRKGLQMSEVEMILDYGRLCFLLSQGETSRALEDQSKLSCFPPSLSGIAKRDTK